MDHEDAVTGLEAALDHQRDVPPVGKRRNTGAAELDDHPWMTRGHAQNSVAGCGDHSLLKEIELLRGLSARRLRKNPSGLFRADGPPGLLRDGSTRLCRVWAPRATVERAGPLCRGCGRSRCCLPPRPGILRLDRSFRYPVRTFFSARKIFRKQ